ncbi:MAG: glycosyltransferase family 2 protein [Candidatus Wallbacteria bacterium]|nr:glycosyltransferase family 2 protein [Candidatus Wallbacteria bacterium]
MAVFLVPVFNEEGFLESFLADFRRVLDPAADRVIFINDGSVDRSREILENFCSGSPEGMSLIVNFPHNKGLTAALTEGMRLALSVEEAFFPVVTLDGDGQHDPACVRQYLRYFLSKKLDVLIVGRDFSLYPKWKVHGNRFLSWFASCCLGCRIYDIESGYRIMSRRALDAVVPKLAGIRYSIAGEIVYLAVLSGLIFENKGRNRIKFYRSRTGFADFFINLFLGMFHYWRMYPGKFISCKE